MGMKPPANEPQSQLAGNLVSGPKDVGSDYASSAGNLVSSAKATAESRTAMPGNVLISGGSTQKPG